MWYLKHRCYLLVEIKHAGCGEPEHHSCPKDHGGLEARSSNERGPGTWFIAGKWHLAGNSSSCAPSRSTAVHCRGGGLSCLCGMHTVSYHDFLGWLGPSELSLLAHAPSSHSSIECGQDSNQDAWRITMATGSWQLQRDWWPLIHKFLNSMKVAPWNRHPNPWSSQSCLIPSDWLLLPKLPGPAQDILRATAPRGDFTNSWLQKVSESGWPRRQSQKASHIRQCKWIWGRWHLTGQCWKRGVCKKQQKGWFGVSTWGPRAKHTLANIYFVICKHCSLLGSN